MPANNYTSVRSKLIAIIFVIILKSYPKCMNISHFIRGGPQSHLDLAKKMQLSQKTNQCLLNSCLKEIAQLEAAKLNTMQPIPKWYSINRRDGFETDFNSVFLRNAPQIGDKDNEIFLIFLSSGEENSTKGTVQLYGKEEMVAHFAPQICDIFDGKGKANKQRFQAKVNNLNNRNFAQCEKLFKEYFDKE